jgi:hypothetical protein
LVLESPSHIIHLIHFSFAGVTEELVGSDDEVVSLQTSCSGKRVDQGVLAVHIRMIQFDKPSKLFLVVRLPCFDAQDLVGRGTGILRPKWSVVSA